MARRNRRQRGSVQQLPSGALRVSVYAGIDPLTKRRHYLREIIPAGSTASAEAHKALRRLVTQVDERRNPRTNATVNQLLDRHFEMLDLEPNTVEAYRELADNHIRPLIGAQKVGALGGDIFDSFYAELRRCRRRCSGRPLPEHRTGAPHDCDDRCRVHMCRPLAPATIRKIHFILGGALKRAVRWRWIATSPIGQAQPPSQPRPNPQPPTTEQAARILAEAWKDPEWGLLVWLTMVTGFRRGELCGLRWSHLDLVAGVLQLARSIGQRSGRTWEKGTKTHQHRRIALDPETVALLITHRQRCVARAQALGVEFVDDAFVFSVAVDGSTHLKPDSVSQRYGRLAARLGIKTSIHKLRHYSATELIAAGVDVRTVAGRLGHGGGGSTTLKVYAAWVSESDQRAATSLFARLPARPDVGVDPAAQRATDPEAAYQKIAAELRTQITSGELAPGAQLPTHKQLAEQHGVSAGTAHRVTALLGIEGLVEVSRGRRATVVQRPAPDADPASSVADAAQAAPEAAPLADSGRPGVGGPGRQLLDLEVRRQGRVVKRLTAEADPKDARQLRQVLVDAVRRDGRDESQIADYEMDIRYSGKRSVLTTFVAMAR
ncbi:MAG: tyrosine-type recombinase/integrase [Pseudonocardiaceae bacterium]